ncbi:hypothetical protein FKP32DRAFT_1679427 [Trametes sanguinea]|nr:hypothetical protein FKP32DRAFT_1679427 [Trametes sanguinea]
MSANSLAQTAVEERTSSLYVIPAASPEKERFGKQYAFKKMLLNWDGPVPSSVDLSRVTNVLDIAAGTCAWTLDLAAMPQIRERVVAPRKGPGTTADGVQLFACDIETKFFPEKNITDGLGITTFQHDVTQPFPADLHNKFDLVRISFLFLCLTSDGWKNALRHCYEVMKPGGILLIDEADPVMYSDMTSAPDEDAHGHDLDKCMNCTGWVGKANRIYAAFAIENGFFVDMTFRLPTLLREEGFEVLDTKRFIVPAGQSCRTLRPDLFEHGFEDFSVENLAFIFEHLASALLAKNKLCDQDGAIVMSSDEMKSMLEEVREGLRQEGGLSFERYCIARKAWV